MACRVFSKNTTIISIVFIFMAFVTYYKLLLSPGIIAHGDVTFPISLEHLYKTLQRSLYMWDSHLFLGYPNRFFADTLLFKLILLFLMVIFPDAVAGKIWFILTLSAAGMGMYYLTCKLTERKNAGFVSALLYMFNPWILERVLSGHLGILMGYAITPFLIGLFIGCINNPKHWSSVKAGLIFGLLIASDIYSSILALVLMTSYTMFQITLSIFMGCKRNDGISSTKRHILNFFLVIGIGFSLHAFWIVPYIYISKHDAIVPSSLLITRGIEQLYSYSSKADIINVIRMSGYWLAYFEKINNASLQGNQVLHNLWLLAGFSLVLLVYSTILLKSDNKKYTIFFSLMAILSIFLGKGPNDPLGGIYIKLFNSLPSAQVLFYEPNKFVYLLVLSYAFLLGVGVSIIIEKLQNMLSDINSKINPLYEINKDHWNIIFIIVVCLLIVGYSWPMFTGNFSGELSTVEYPDEYKDLDRWLASQNGDYRILFLPPWYFAKYDWLPPQYEAIRDHLIIFPPKNVVAFGYGDLSDKITRFVLYETYYGKTEYVGKLLGLLGVKYIVLRTDANDIEPSRFNTTNFGLYILPNLKGIKQVWNSKNNNIVVYENSYAVPRFFASKRKALVIGDLRILTSLSFLEKYDFTVFPTIFINQIDSKIVKNIIERSSLIIVQDSKIPEIVFSMMKDPQIISPWLYTNGSRDPYQTWVSSSLIFDATGLEIPNTETDFWVITRKHGAQLDMPFTVPYEGNFEIWVKLFNGPIITKFPNIENDLLLMIDNNTIKADFKYDTNQLMRGFTWFRVASAYITSNSSHTISIINGKGTSIISKIAIIPQGDYDRYYNQTLDIIKRYESSTLYVLEAENSFKPVEGWRITDEQGIYASNGLSLVSYEEAKNVSITSGEFYIIKPGMHMLALRIASDVPTDLMINIDKTNYNLGINNTDSFKYYYVGPLYLSIGKHQINILVNQRIYFDKLILYNTYGTDSITLTDFFITNSYGNISYNQINPVNYNIYIEQTDTPMFLVFLESYDTWWNVHYGDKRKKAILVFSYANGFFIDETVKNQFINVKYLGYEYQRTGTVISIFTLAIIITFFLVRPFIVKKS